MQDIVTWHNITIYHTCVLHGMIHVLCAFVQIRSHVIDAKNRKIQDLKVHITNSLQLPAAKLLLFFELCKFICKNQDFVAENLRNSKNFSTFAADFIIKLAGNGIYIRHTVFRGLLRQCQNRGALRGRQSQNS